MDKKTSAPFGALGHRLAAAAVVVAATAAAVVIAGHIAAVITAAAEEDQQDDDPAPVTTAETIVAHKKYLRNFVAGLPLIPRYSKYKIWCKRKPPLCKGRPYCGYFFPKRFCSQFLPSTKRETM